MSSESERPHADVVVTREGHVAHVTIDRPAAANTLSRAVRAQLAQLLSELEDDHDTRVIVLRGSGEKMFCAGVDLKESGGQARLQQPMKALERNLFELILEIEKPMIASLNGHAVGGGLELALACDFRVAAAGIRMGLPEAKVGMGANFGSVLLPRLIPRGLAMEMLYTGRLIDAQEALACGLVNAVLPDAAALDAHVRALAGTIAANAPLSVRKMKAVNIKSQGLPVAAALRLNVGPDPYRSEDRIEGARAFLEKRAPRFEGR